MMPEAPDLGQREVFGEPPRNRLAVNGLRALRSGNLSATSVVPLISFSCLAIKTPSFVETRSGSMKSDDAQYAIVLIFLEGRLPMAIPTLAHHGMGAIVLINWGCLAVTLVVMERSLHWREVCPSVPRR